MINTKRSISKQINCGKLIKMGKKRKMNNTKKVTHDVQGESKTNN